MLARLFPKERDFFPIFDRISACLAEAISELLWAIESPELTTKAIANANNLQLQADKLVRQSVEHLHESFITPFDRIHIFRFVTQLGEIVSQSLLTTKKLQDYGIDRLPSESIEIVAKCGESCILVRKMVQQLRKLKKPDDTIELCLKIYQLSADTMALSFKASMDLFNHQSDLRNVIKIREINEDLVNMIRKFNAISYLIEETILEYA